MQLPLARFFFPFVRQATTHQMTVRFSSDLYTSVKRLWHHLGHGTSKDDKTVTISLISHLDKLSFGSISSLLPCWYLEHFYVQKKEYNIYSPVNAACTFVKVSLELNCNVNPLTIIVHITWQPKGASNEVLKKMRIPRLHLSHTFKCHTIQNSWSKLIPSRFQLAALNLQIISPKKLDKEAKPFPQEFQVWSAQPSPTAMCPWAFSIPPYSKKKKKK